MMMRWFIQLLLVLLMTVTLTGCPAGDGSSDVSSDDVSADTTAEDTDVRDGTTDASDADADEETNESDVAKTDTTDLTPSDADVETTDQTEVDAVETTDMVDGDMGSDTAQDVAEGELILGHHEAFENTPEAFRTLDEGGDLDVVFGPQGAYMVVLGLKSRGVITDEFSIQGELVVNEEVLGTLSLEGQTLFDGGDGYAYYYNFFLAIDTFEPPDMVDGRVDVSITAAGATHVITRNVFLIAER